MPRPKLALPTYRLHKPSGQAICFVDRKTIYLGKYGTPESKLKFSQTLAQLQVGAQAVAQPSEERTALSINEVALAFLIWAEQHYRQPHTGKPTTEYDCHKSMVRILSESFGLLPVSEFGPNKLRVVQDAMVAAGWGRQFVNRSVGRVRFLFKWAVSRELVAETVWLSLKSVEPLLAGKSNAVEYAPRVAVSDADIEAVRSVLNPTHRDVFDLILLTGARPSEIIRLTMGEIDRTGNPWKATLLHHKTAHRGKTRVLFFNSAAQAILQRHLKAEPTARLFQLRRDNFNHHIGAACAKTGVPKFVAHQLRHTAATKIRDQLGIETAAAVLGHSKIDMTSEYSRAADQHAIRGVQALG